MFAQRANTKQKSKDFVFIIISFGAIIPAHLQRDIYRILGVTGKEDLFLDIKKTTQRLTA